MKKFALAATALSLGAGSAFAGGIDRSGQSISSIFEKGTYAEISFGMVTPSVSGSIGGVVNSGDMADNYFQVGAAYKQQVNDQLSFGIIFDQPYGANVDYPGTFGVDPYPLAGANAELKAMALTALARYQINENFSVHGGLRYQTLEATAEIPLVGGYTVEGERDAGVGFVAGAAYEVPDIALRVALTYNSKIEHVVKTTEFGALTSKTKVNTPESINLDFQTGVAADTLVFGGIRYVKWSDFDITPVQYLGATGGSLVSYDDDTITYNIGVGRKFTETFSGSASLTYEKQNGGIASNLGPTDGKFGVTLGGRYMMGNTAISGGINYTWIGDADTSVGASFKDNSAIGVGVKIGMFF